MRTYYDYNWPGKEGTKVFVHDDGNWKYVYYEDHEERYKGKGWRERELYPDEIVIPFTPVIKRIRNSGELTVEEWEKYGSTFIHLAAKDIPVD